jgi:indolepyruvate ferredoxin oxidoreductase alpha subunit
MEITNEDNVGKKILLLGNEAITRGALEAGVNVATAYPGTPSTEIADTFSMIATAATHQNKDPGFYFEYSTNEKVALELAAAASLSNLRALTCMKHVGLNVASDAFLAYLYLGCKGGHIIVSADDPSSHSSQNEQDNRYYALFANCPMLEPATPEEAKEMTRIGFDLSEELQLPILLRTTTRLNHTRGPVTYKKRRKPQGKGHFKKDPLITKFPVTAHVRHPQLLKKIEQAETLSEKSSFNTVITQGKPQGIGIVTSGVSFNYVKEAAKELKLDVQILKLGMTNPLPRKMCADFITSCDIIVVVEELEPILENQLNALAHNIGSKVKIYGKSTGHFSRLYEYNPDIVTDVLAEIFKIPNPLPKLVKSTVAIPSRPPVLCPGCPHRATYYAAKKAASKGCIFPNDIGCYILGKMPPLKIADVLLCMGANAGMACGFAVATDQKIISFMGDSTFFHSGIPPIIDAVHHNHDCVITVLDNRTTAMTGYQSHPGTMYDGMGRPARNIMVEDVVRGLGVEHVEVVNPNNIEETTEAFKRALEFKGTAVVVSKSPCILQEITAKRENNESIAVYQINQKKCTQCEICIERFGCPAILYGNDASVHIDETLCNGCGVCIQICPSNAITKKKETD